jgi:predicted metal-dependent TIM-barrel fold hydrolase
MNSVDRKHIYDAIGDARIIADKALVDHIAANLSDEVKDQIALVKADVEAYEMSLGESVDLFNQNQMMQFAAESSRQGAWIVFMNLSDQELNLLLKTL